MFDPEESKCGIRGRSPGDRRLGIGTALLAWMCLACLRPVEAQPRPAPLEETACRDCRIGLERIAVIGDLSGPAGLGPDFTIVRSRTSGRYWYASNASRGEILLFDPDGRFLETIGGEGQGPGEFRYITQIVAGRESVHVIDVANSRWTIMDDRPGYPTLATARLLRGPFESTIMGDSLLLASIDIATQELAGVPLHLIDADGKIVRSFGGDGSGQRPDRTYAMPRHVAPASEARAWIAQVSRYLLERRTLDGRLDLLLEREVDWFQPHHEPIEAHPDVPPAPWLAGIQEDTEGRLWVLSLVADEEWHEGVIERRDGSFDWAGDKNGFWDTIVEVIDPDTQRVLASTRFDQAIRHFVDDRLVAVYRESEPGVPTVEIWRLTADF